MDHGDRSGRGPGRRLLHPGTGPGATPAATPSGARQRRATGRLPRLRRAHRAVCPQHPIHVDSALFEFGPSDDLGGNHHCRAQITVSPHDPQIATPSAYTDLLGTKLCDADWFGTQFNESWRLHDPGNPQLWTLKFSYTDVGWFSVSDLPAVGVVLFVPDRRFTVGLWTLEEVYSNDEALALVQEVARFVG